MCASLLGSVCAALVFAFPLALCFTPATALAANACVTKGVTGALAGGGIGGTGAPPEGGIGGTGAIAEGGIGGTGAPPDGGVGGTGAIAGGGIGGTGHTGVAVVGTITGFASICINGLEVHYTPALQVVANGLPSSVAELAVGQVVTIEAAGIGGQADELAGGRVSILNAVAGPVGSIDNTARSLVVLGQTVLVTAQTLIADPTGIKTFDFLQTGGLVRVSGLRLANGDIVASRIETALSLPQATVLGPVTQSDSNGFSIYGLRVGYADVTGASAVTSGEVMVSGRLDGATLRPERIALAPSLEFTQQVDRLVLEGYIGSRSDSAISVGGVSVSLNASPLVGGGVAADLQINQRVQIVGRLMADHSMVADVILLRRDPLAPPSAASIFPPSKSKALTLNKPGDDKSTAILSNSPTGTAATGGSVAANGGHSAGGSQSGGGSSSGMGGGIITPGGGATTAPAPKPVGPIARPGTPASPFKFDTLELKLPGMPHHLSH
jgi:hypothetical protein